MTWVVPESTGSRPRPAHPSGQCYPAGRGTRPCARTAPPAEIMQTHEATSTNLHRERETQLQLLHLEPDRKSQRQHPQHPEAAPTPHTHPNQVRLPAAGELAGGRNRLPPNRQPWHRPGPHVFSPGFGAQRVLTFLLGFANHLHTFHSEFLLNAVLVLRLCHTHHSLGDQA